MRSATAADTAASPPPLALAPAFDDFAFVPAALGDALALALAGAFGLAAFAAAFAGAFAVGAAALALPAGAFLSVAAGPAVGRLVVVATVTSSSGRPSRPTG